MSELVCVFYMGNKMSVPGVHRRVLPGVGVFMDFRNFFSHFSFGLLSTAYAKKRRRNDQ